MVPIPTKTPMTKIKLDWGQIVGFVVMLFLTILSLRNHKISETEPQNLFVSIAIEAEVGIGSAST